MTTLQHQKNNANYEDDKDKTLLPQYSWAKYEDIIKALAEEEDTECGFNEFDFLRSLKLIEHGYSPELTELGKRYYDERFIKSQESRTNEILRQALLQFPPCEVILQLLHGVKGAKRTNALSVLKSRGYWSYDNESPLTNLLLMMNGAGLIVYSKKHGTIQVIHNLALQEIELPSSIFIDPTRPYSNKLWLKKILADCEDYIYWIDKHFMKECLEYISEIADANKIKDVKILSLGLNTNARALKEYHDLKMELGNKGITMTWYKINSTLIRDNHDRWILSRKKVWNVPDSNSILSGKYSEFNRSNSLKEMAGVFSRYLKDSKEIQIS